MRLSFLFCFVSSMLSFHGLATGTGQENTDGGGSLSSAKHGLAMYGEPLLKPDFPHLSYVNPQAPKGGKLTFGAVGTFDGVNPFVIKNFRTTARGLFADSQFGSLVYETMMVRSYDEPFTLYGLLAEKVEINKERTQITFSLRKAARFSDNVPVSVDDVIFTHQLLLAHGRPPYSSYMKQIEKIEDLGGGKVRFWLVPQASRELALLIASSMPILPRHSIEVADFSDNGLVPIPGSGPYLIDKIEAGKHITYRRNPDYWGRNLPVNIGLYNFDRIQIDYYRNENARFEAFKKGLLDVFIEEDPNRWLSGYDFIGMRLHQIEKEIFQTKLPAPVLGFVFNTRRKIFHDMRVRLALSLLVDFEWMNRNLYHNAYQRTYGFWDGSTLSSLESLEHTSVSDEGQKSLGFDRQNAQKAQELLYQAGFRRRDGIFYQPDGRRFSFEILFTRAGDEKFISSYARSLARLGIEMRLRQVDDSQYQNRSGNFDYDMIVGRLSSSLSPGTEQLNRWSSQAAHRIGSFNFAGVREDAIDNVLQTLLSSRSNEDFVASVRVLDHLLIAGHYVIPLYHLPGQRIARWSHIRHPQATSLHGYRLPAWWYEEKLSSK